MNNAIKILLICLALIFISAIKPHYGGEMTIRLNEPENFSYSPSSYSHLVFYSLIYENLFYLKANGDVETHLFSRYHYDKASLTLNLQLKENLHYSDGTPITTQNIKVSLTLFLELSLSSSRKLRRVIKEIRLNKDPNLLSIILMHDDANIVSSLTAPELVLVGGSDQSYSGSFYPTEWVKNRYIQLTPNPYYPGGRTYLDSMKVVFYDFYYPDIFLSDPGLTNDQFRELDAGIYQNMFLGFPKGRVGDSTRIALYSLLKDFYKTQGSNLTELNAFTSNEESPVTLNIKSFSRRRVRSILRNTRIKLYILSSLNKIAEPLTDFLGKKRLSIETIFVSDTQLVSFMNNNSIKYLLMGKTFNRRMPLEEKIKVILKEMSFGRFNEDYLQMLNQLDEVKFLKNEELLIDLVSRIVERIIKDGFILPLYQRKYSIYVKKKIKGIQLDYYGKPLFREIRAK